jgi:hypothetical protein
VFVLRCTRKLLRRMGLPALSKYEVPKSTTRLGDWTANLLVVGRQQIVLAVSNVTLLPVLLPAAPFKSLPSRLPEAVGHVLDALRIDPHKIAAEISAMNECLVAPTNDRRVLGTMNDFDRMLDAYLDGRSLLGVALHLADAPCGPIGMASPNDETMKVLSAPVLRLLKGGAR